jgi:hypothetical protein
MEIFRRDVGPAAVQKLAALEIATWRKVRAKRTELESAESEGIRAIADALESGTVATPGEKVKVRKLRDEVHDLTSLLGEFRNRRIATIAKMRDASVMELRARAGEKRNQIAELDRKTAPLLLKLSELEGVPFDRGVLHAQRLAEFSGNRELYLGTIAGTYVPNSHKIGVEAEFFEKRAEQLQTTPLEASGMAEGDSLDELVTDILNHPGRITPELQAVEVWFAESSARVVRFEEQNYPAPLVKPDGIHFHLEWSEGECSKRIRMSRLSTPTSVQMERRLFRP